MLEANFKGDNGPHGNIVVRPPAPPAPPTSQPGQDINGSNQSEPLVDGQSAPEKVISANS